MNLSPEHKAAIGQPLSAKEALAKTNKEIESLEEQLEKERISVSNGRVSIIMDGRGRPLELAYLEGTSSDEVLKALQKGFSEADKIRDSLITGIYERMPKIKTP